MFAPVAVSETSLSSAAIPPDIDSLYPLTSEQIEFYRENGYIKLKQVLSADAVAFYRDEISRKVLELSTQTKPISERSTYDKAFLQVTNLWTKSALAKQFVFGKRLARLAAELMQVRGVRLWHDQALYKEPGGGITPWHADQYYWPLSSDKSITAWVPLQETPLEMGPLAFAPGSSRIQIGRDLEIGEESEQQIKRSLKAYPVHESPFALGEVSFHSGWTFHRASENSTARPREVMTVIYIDQDMRLAAPRNNHQKIDWQAWCPDVKVGEVIDAPLTPVLWSAKA